MCSIGEEPPPLIDPTKRKPKPLDDLSQKATDRADDLRDEAFDDEEDELEEIDVDRLLAGYYDEDGAFIWDDDENEDGDEDEDEYDEEEDEEEEDEEEYELEEEEEDSFEDEDCDLDAGKEVCTFCPSDAKFQESDLEDRKNRRYVIGVHSFQELADPQLEDALEPVVEEPDWGECGGPSEEEKSRLTLKEEKAKYKDLCNQLGVSPNPKVLASLREPIMDLTNMGMNAKEVTAVCRLLETNVFVQWLSLAGNSAGAEGGMALAELIQKNRTIHTYILFATELLEAFDAICDAIAHNPIIVNLNFSKNDLEDVDMPGIRKILRGESNLLVLNLNSNLIKDDGLKMIGQGLMDNKTLEDIDLSHNKFMGDKKTGVFFQACSEHPELKFISLRRNFIGDDGGKGFGRILGKNPKIEEIDVSFNLLGEGAATAMGRNLGKLDHNLTKLLLEFQRFRQQHAAAILKPLGNELVKVPFLEVVDFGMMLDVHTDFLKEKERALRVHPELQIIHGQTYGMEHANGPDHKQMVIRKADAVCKSFETPLVMLMEELAKEKKYLTQKEFRKFIKQCNLYKDKTVTEAFEKVFEKEGEGIDADAILEAFDKEYPGLRKIPEPVEEDEEEEMQEKPKKEKKGKKGKGKKGKKGKGEGGGGAKKGGKGKGKGKKKK